MACPEFVKEFINELEWNSWSEALQNFIIQNHNTKITPESLKGKNLHAFYKDKSWKFGPARPEVGEICKCGFAYCFYAMPRNWSLGTDADVWNLMRCANVNCGEYFESCL